MFRFPWGDFHSLNLGWFLQKFNELRQDWATAEAGIDGALDAEIQKAEDALTDVFAARDAAQQAATNAAASETAAGQSATSAGQSATSADQSATAAGQSATAAGQSATAAGQSATNAAASETAAGNSAAAAAASETAAGQSATAAGQSATNAAASETAAGNSAAAAAASETAAGQSAEDAENAASSVEALAQQIVTNTNEINDLKEANAVFLNQIPTKESEGYANRVYDGADNIPIKEVSFADGVTYFALGIRETPTKDKPGTTLSDTGEEISNRLQRLVEYLTENINSITIAVYKSEAGYRTIQIFGYNEDESEATLISRFNNEHGFIRTYDTTPYNHIKIDISNSSNIYFATIYAHSALSPELVKTFKGENTFMATNRNISLVYRCDIQTYIEEEIAQVQATLLENIGG